MSQDNIICLENIGKRYFLREKRFLTKDIVKKLMHADRKGNEVWALKDVNLSISPGEIIGIIGENGSGKSTLLKIISNVTKPTEGHISINGTVASLLELGAGFHPYLTGRENIFLNGVILGLKRREIKQILDEIIEFSGIKDFIDTPVQYYSSGMYVRLGFAVAINLKANILIVDEVLSVGDIDFQRKCTKAIMNAVDHGKTVIFVTHDMNLLQNLCTKAVWLEKGKIQKIGNKHIIVSEYLKNAGQKVSSYSLQGSHLSLVFYHGKIDLLWDNILLTKRVGIFTEFVSQGDVRYSTDCLWELEYIDEKNLILNGKWKILPIVQKWSIKMISENEVSLKVETTVTADLYVEYTSIVMELPDIYKYWISSTGSGAFPEQFYEMYGQRLIGVGQEDYHIGVKSAKMDDCYFPSVHFEMVWPKEGYLSQVANTDRFSRCRTLQFSKISRNDMMLKGERFAFEIKITVSPN